MSHEERKRFLEGRKGIGSSDVPKILGWSKFGGPAEVYDSVVATLEDRVVVDEPSFPAQRGIILEPIAAERWCAAHDRDTATIRRQPQRSHPAYPFMNANIDRQVLSRDGSGPAILEIKCPMITKFMRVRDFGEIQEYVAQVQHQLAIFDYPMGYLAVYHPDFPDMIDIEILKDNEFIDNVLHPKLINFWENYIVPRRRPEESSGELSVKIPELQGGRLVIDETQEFENRVRKWKHSKELLDTTKAIHDQNCRVLKDYMEEREMVGVAGAGVRIHYRDRAGGMTWDLKKVADFLNAQGMEVAEFKYQKKSSRPFLVYADDKIKDVQQGED